MTTDLLIIVSGMVGGLLIHTVFIRPHQLAKWERRRRALGLPPKRHLPEDDEPQ
jgi:hypothetical protein